MGRWMDGEEAYSVVVVDGKFHFEKFHISTTAAEVVVGRRRWRWNGGGGGENSTKSNVDGGSDALYEARNHYAPIRRVEILLLEGGCGK